MGSSHRHPEASKRLKDLKTRWPFLRSFRAKAPQDDMREIKTKSPASQRGF
jgi:hypothetical protein